MIFFSPSAYILREICCPACDPRSLESNVPGIYLAGVIIAGDRTNEIFIENGRFHGGQIAEDLKQKLHDAAPAFTEV